MRVGIGADHGGFDLKELLKKHLLARGLTLKDFGALEKNPADDYPDFVLPAAQAVADGLAKSAPTPPSVDARDAPEIAWVAEIGAVAPEEKSPPNPLYLRAPDAQPQNAAQLPRR